MKFLQPLFVFLLMNNFVYASQPESGRCDSPKSINHFKFICLRINKIVAKAKKENCSQEKEEDFLYNTETRYFFLAEEDKMKKDTDSQIENTRPLAQAFGESNGILCMQEINESIHTCMCSIARAKNKDEAALFVAQEVANNKAIRTRYGN